MPTLPAFMSYRPQLKGKVKSPFARRRFESPTIPFSPLPPSEEVLNIGDPGRGVSLDFCDSSSPSFDSQNRPMLTVHRPSSPRPPSLRPPSPRLQLELDLSTDTEQLSDWFSTSFPRTEPSAAGPSRLVEPMELEEIVDDDIDGGMVKGEEVFEDSIESMPSGDVIANLEAMNASSFGRLRPDSVMTVLNPPNRLKGSGSQQGLISQPEEDGVQSNKSRPLSEVSSPPSSAVSGTTIARQLMGNGFSLSHDHRGARLRSFVGLTRSDSLTLPREYEDRFEVGPDAPPIPPDAEVLYVAPKTSRDPGGQTRTKTLKRRSSTGSMTIPEPDSDALPIPPSPPRPNSASMSPSDFNPAFPHSPFRPSPSPPMNEGADHLERKKIPPAISVSAGQFRSASGDAMVAMLETDGSTSSPQNLEDVLDYYSFTDGPEGTVSPIQRGYRPVFTPITEESLSQLSPPAPYSKGDRRDPQRHQPLGARSPASSTRVRSMLSTERSVSEMSTASSLSRSSTLQLAKAPSNSQLPTPTTSVGNSIPNPHNSQISSSSSHSPLIPPPPLSKVFNRQRSGSAPSPIKVVQETQGLSRYEIAIDSRDAGSWDNTPTTGESTGEQQLPESATAPWSAVNSPDPAVHIEGEADPQQAALHMSAALPVINSVQPNVQHLLLTRAATSARTRHSRQASTPFQRGHSSDGKLEEVQQSPRFKAEVLNEGDKGIPPQKPPPKRSLPPSPSPSAGRQSPMRVPPPIQEAVTKSNGDLAPPPTTHSLIVRSPSTTTSVQSNDSDYAPTHVSQNPAWPASKSLFPIPPSPESPSPSSSLPSPTQSATRGLRGKLPQPLELSKAAVPLQIVAEGPSTPGPETTVRGPQEALPSDRSNSPARRAPLDSPPPPLQSSSSRKSSNTIDEILRASTLGSPPPYYSIVDQLHPRHQAPGFATQQKEEVTPPIAPSPAPSGTMTFTNPFGSHPRESTMSRSKLGRPAGPLGPRRPTVQSGVALPFPERDRSGSIASITRQPSISAAGPSTGRAGRRGEFPPLTSPKFQPPPIKHRGYTMEAAKWTFTSSQLQSVVSRAIRESAQTSSIRLLKLESLEEEIPEEIHRLEMYRTDIKSKYKASTKRRAFLLEALTFHLNSSTGEESTSSVPLRIVEELSSIAGYLDHMAEELHSTDLQLAQLKSLVQVHSTSALSMALRKLNASFLNQVGENKALQERITVLEAERDEAWKNAEDLAIEFDQDKHDESTGSNRSSRISAKRKSSLRATKAGLRSQSRRQSSARSSTISNSYGPLATPLSSRSQAFRTEKIPPLPLPPIPKRRPAGIITDYNAGHGALGSSGALSLEGITPTSEARAMAEAEEELYTMLGLSIPHSGLRRARSMVGLPSAGFSPPPVSARIGALSRRSSLPGEATLAEVQNAMLADRNAVVFTFEMLQDSDGEQSGIPYSRFS